MSLTNKMQEEQQDSIIFQKKRCKPLDAWNKQEFWSQRRCLQHDSSMAWSVQGSHYTAEFLSRQVLVWNSTLQMFTFKVCLEGSCWKSRSSAEWKSRILCCIDRACRDLLDGKLGQGDEIVCRNTKHFHWVPSWMQHKSTVVNSLWSWTILQLSPDNLQNHKKQ